MAEQFSVTSGASALTAATVKYLIQLATGSTIDNALVEFDISFDGSATGTNATVDVCRATAATTTSGATYTPLKYGQNQSRSASITTARINDTAGGGTVTPLQSFYVPVNSGLSIQWPLGRELAMIASTFLVIRVTSPVGVNALSNVVFEE